MSIALLYRRGRIVPFELFTYGKAFVERADCQKSPVQPTCADGRDTYRTAKLRRVLRTKQPKHNESEALPAAETAELELGQLSKFTSALRRAMEIWLTAIKGAAVCLLQARCDGRSKSREPQPPGGRNFCPAYAGRNGFPLERVVFRHEDRLQSLSLFCLPGWNFRHVRPG